MKNMQRRAFAVVARGLLEGLKNLFQAYSDRLGAYPAAWFEKEDGSKPQTPLSGILGHIRLVTPLTDLEVLAKQQRKACEVSIPFVNDGTIALSIY